MAKQDFCFTYYDGDAARDMAHMDRLTRGAYNDLIIHQRKVKDGLLSMEHIKGALGADFEKCWFGLQIILKKCGEFFYIEWVKNSVEKMKENSKKQSEKAKNRWEKENLKIDEKTICNATALNNDATALKNDANAMPLEDGNGNENKDEFILGHEMKFFFQNFFPKYAFYDNSDMDAILEFQNFIASQNKIKNIFPNFNLVEKQVIFKDWKRFCNWFKNIQSQEPEHRWKTKSISFLSKFCITEIFNELNQNKNGTELRTSLFKSSTKKPETTGDGGY